MAYDKELKAKIDAMGAGDLVHTMLAHFDPRQAKEDNGDAQTWLQPSAYFWAAERLNELMTAKEKDDD